MRRALIVHPGMDFSVSDVFRGWMLGLEANGFECKHYNLNDRLTFFTTASDVDPDTGEVLHLMEWEEARRAASLGVLSAAYAWWPDVILCVSPAYMPPDIIDIMVSRGHHVVGLFTESPYEDNRQLEYAPHFTTCIVNDPTNLEKFREVCPNTYYLPHAYDPRVHHPGPSNIKSDVAFVGTGFPTRVEFLEAVPWDDLGVDFLLAGQWPKESTLWKFVPEYDADRAGGVQPVVNNDDEVGGTIAIYRGTKMSFNLYRRETYRDLGGPGHGADDVVDGWAMGPREVELAAAGVFYARDPRPEGDELFPMLPQFSTPAELSDIVRWAMDHPVEREAAAAAARAAVADRTFEANAGRLCRWLEQQ